MLRFWSAQKKIIHGDPETTTINDISDDYEFIRNSGGTTIVVGSVGHGVKLTIEEDATLIIQGNIGTKCKIFISRSSSLFINGTVADDLKITIYGQSHVEFRIRPPERVLDAIKDRSGMARVMCTGVDMPNNSATYVHHNLGNRADSQSRYTFTEYPPQQVMQRSQTVQPASQRSSSAQNASVPTDDYTELTREYIETTRAHNVKTIAQRIEELNLTEEEASKFEQFVDPISGCYFDDIPIQYNEKYYALSSFLQTYKTRGVDPYTRAPLRLTNVQPARNLTNALDDVIQDLNRVRQEAKNGERIKSVAP